MNHSSLRGWRGLRFFSSFSWVLACRAWEYKKLYHVVDVGALPNAADCAQQLHRKRAALLAIIARCVAGAARGYARSQGEDCAEFAVAELRKSGRNSKSGSKLLIRVDAAGPTLGVAGKWVRDSWGGPGDAFVPRFREASKSSKKLYVTDELVAALVRFDMPRILYTRTGSNRGMPRTVLALNIEAAGHNCWVLEVYLLGI